MTNIPSEKWRLSNWLSIDHAARLIENIDPNAYDDELSESERREVKACRVSIWETARSSDGSAGVKIEYSPGIFDNTVSPSECDSRVSVEWVKNLLSSKGVTSGFFFPSPTPPSEVFMDPAHEHFSPELALAVTVWRALETEQKFISSPRNAIKAWIKDNSEAWQSEEPIKKLAIERIATLVNWEKKGGAPKSGS